MNAQSYIQKAERALAGARALVTAGDVEGACNRAYYAMFDAAHAALLSFGVSGPDANPKTHRGLIGTFGKRLVLGGHLPAELGVALNKVERLRTLADYTGEPITSTDAAWAVEKAEAFVVAISAAIPPRK